MRGWTRCRQALSGQSLEHGTDWKPLPNLVVKADYTTRQIGTSKMFGSSDYNSENEFRIGVAYQLWFAKK